MCSAGPGHPPLHLVGDEPQHGQGFQGNLKLHRLRLLLQLLWRDKHSLRIAGPISQELQGGRLWAASVTTDWGGNQSPAKQTLLLLLIVPALPVCQGSCRSAHSPLLLIPHPPTPNGSWVATSSSAPAQGHLLEEASPRLLLSTILGSSCSPWPCRDL